MIKQKIGILGYGRFGTLLHSLLADDFEVYFYDNDKTVQKNNSFKPLGDILALPVLYLCIPINQMEPVLKDISETIKAHTVIDTCSVKTYPVQLMLQYLPTDINIIATHPMFGQDSFFSTAEKCMMMHPVRIGQDDFTFWKEVFSKKNINIKLMTPEQHDMQSAYSQNITHVIGRTLGELDLKKSDISTKGYTSLLTLINQTCNDSRELFNDMLQFNPYSKEMLDKLQQAFQTIINTTRQTNNQKAIDNGK